MEGETNEKQNIAERADIDLDEINKDTDERNADVPSENDEDEKGRDLKRDERFVENDDHPEFLQSRQLKNMKPFYSGSILDERNATMRWSNYYIRQHWDEYNTFTDLLKELFLSDEPMEFKDRKTEQDFERLFSKQRNWMTEESVHTEPCSSLPVLMSKSRENLSKIGLKKPKSRG
ncbi:hypothetical protein DPMN_086767 [Dreissena polymorpha]|uniref:Uncharacterized protein n=1 Tax=Dreissena polymorpha TaxID=45954 RepID=A0A9D4KRS8_DREPO|nr:hypothetical protein DPMN_086767 [Dreissena polymorpha]